MSLQRIACTLIAALILPLGCRDSNDSFRVGNRAVRTGILVKAGSTVRVTADGQVNFGSGLPLPVGAPELNADGDSWATPPDYPAPSLRKNSLICRVGPLWYQGGVDKTFRPSHDGELILQPNDKQLEDNKGVWRVRVYVSR